VLKWEAIARAETHPVRLAVLELMVSAPPGDDPGCSSSTLAETLGLPLPTTSHHVRLLRERGLLVEVGRKQVRGAMQTFLGLSDAALDG
jgi:hypothetical protein